MFRFRLLIFTCCLLAVLSSCQGQTVRNTTWKTYFPSITDTVTLKFANDSSSIRTSTGVSVLLSVFKLSRDLITFRDYGGMNACADLPGSYHIRMDGDTLMFEMDEDPCDGRGGSLITKRWVRVF